MLSNIIYQCYVIWHLMKISFGGIPNSRNVIFLPLSLKHAAKPSTGNTSACSKASQTFSRTFSRTLLNLTRLCTKASQTFSGTFSGTLLNLTRHCTKASQAFSGPFSAPKPPKPCPEPSPEPIEPDLALHQSFPDLLRNLVRNPVEPDLALHQSLPDLLQNLLENPVELDPALHQSFPDLLRNLLRNPVEPDLALMTFARTLPEPCWTRPGPVEPELAPHQSLPDLLRNLLRNLPQNRVEHDLALHQSFLEPFPESSPERCWTWPGSAPKHPRRSPEPSPEPCWTWPGFAPKPPKPFPEPSLHQSLPGLVRNLLRNPLNLTWPSPEPSPEPRWTWPGACTSAQRSYSGLKTPLAYAVGEISILHYKSNYINIY